MTKPTLDEPHLKSWIGETEKNIDFIAASTARKMQATLDREPDLEDGDPLPPLWHWCYFHACVPQSGLDRDGHPKRGGFLPPVPLPRRMWAGGRLEFAEPVSLGEKLTKISTIEDVVVKTGRSGTLCFVTVGHEFTGEDGSHRLSEEHDIVYREDPAPGAKSPEPPRAADGGAWQEKIEPSPVMLFRYSALTFNGHRIHYDRDYCKDVEGYPGIVFHGPLTATLLADLAIRNAAGRALKTFGFRAVSPLFDTAPFTIDGKPANDGTYELWAANPNGRLAMTASAKFN